MFASLWILHYVTKMVKPDYIFETSWEVCNKVGGIYAVLSTKARSMQTLCPDRVVFFGPDLHEQSNKFFIPDEQVLTDWRASLKKVAHPVFRVRVGRWNVPGKPLAVLVDFTSLWLQKDEIFGWAWQHYGVQSHAAYGDYDESCLFGYAAGMAMESLYRWIDKNEQKKTVVAHANEWQAAFSIFYLRQKCPKIGTLFTTHATGIGRSIAGNGKPLYDYFEGYHGDQMAEELNMVSKHSVEKMAAKWADCFTTVSDITARECTQLLDKTPDVVTPNGFEPDFVPKGRAFSLARVRARKSLLDYARKMGVEEYGSRGVGKEPLLIGIAGRLEWKNKGIDVFMEAMRRLGVESGEWRVESGERKQVIAFVMVPYLNNDTPNGLLINDDLMNGVKVIFVPYYLDGRDPIFGLTYYELLIGLDLTIFPSYYEPWGYTPHESVAFHVPTVTTSLSGFGDWASKKLRVKSLECREAASFNSLEFRGVTVIERNDSNYNEVVNKIVETIEVARKASKKQMDAAREEAAAIAQKGEWKDFFSAYLQAYDFALRARNRR